MNHREPIPGDGSPPASRRETADRLRILSFGPFRFDRHLGTLERDGTMIPLTPKAQDLLSCLLEKPGVVVPKETLLERVWGDTTVTDHSLTEAVRTLRKTLGDDSRRPRYIQTAHRRGYRFVAPVVAPDEPVVPDQPAAPVGTETPAPPDSFRPDRWKIRSAFRWTLAGAVVGVALIGWLTLTRVSSPSHPAAATVRLISPAEGDSFPLSAQSLMFDPPGATLFYTKLGAGGGQLVAHRLADGDTRPVYSAHNRPLNHGDVSPDGTRIAFARNSSIELMSVADDRIIEVCGQCALGTPDLKGEGLTFAGNDAIVFVAAGELREIPTAGGDWRVLVRPPAEVHAGGYTFPHALPGGEWVLATLLRGRSVDRAEIVLVDAATGASRLLIRDGVNARYVASGHVVFVRDGDLWAVPFDLERRALAGEPALVREGIMMSAASGLSHYAVSQGGDLAYIAGDTYSPSRRIVSVGRDGRAEPLLDARGRFEGVQLSPDFTRVAVEAIDGGDYDIRIYDLDDGSGEPITLGSEFVDERHPVWNADGSRIAFAATYGEVTTLYWKRADGDLDRQYVDGELDSRRGAQLIPQSWSGDGVLAYVVVEDDRWDIWTVDVNGGRPRPFLTADREVGAAFSPDGLWLAYSVIAASDDGPTGIRVVSYPEPRTVMDLGSWGTNLQWSADGRELCFAGPGLRCVGLLTAPGSEPDIRFGDPQRTGGGFYYHRHRFSIGPDGQSFAVVDEASFQPPRASEIVLVTDWFDDLQRLAPIDR